MRSGTTDVIHGGIWRNGVLSYTWGSRVDAVQDNIIGLRSHYAFSFWSTGILTSNGPLDAVMGNPLRGLGNGGGNHTNESLGHAMNIHLKH